MSDQKYVFLIDVDETLIPHNSRELSIAIAKEIDRLKKLGHIFVVSTGRSLKSTLSIKGIEHFQYLSVLLGSCIYKMPDKEILYKSQAMPKAQVKEFVEYLNSKNIAWSYKDAATEKSIFSDDEFFKNKNCCDFVSLKEFEDDLEHNRIMQLLVAGYLTKDEILKFPDFEFCLMPKNYMDITVKNFSKDRCVEFFKNRFPYMTTVAIGDSVNDLPMFNKADISIAMGNALLDLKDKATFVTKDINDGGLIYAFRNILGI